MKNVCTSGVIAIDVDITENELMLQKNVKNFIMEKSNMKLFLRILKFIFMALPFIAIAITIILTILYLDGTIHNEPTLISICILSNVFSLTLGANLVNLIKKKITKFKEEHKKNPVATVKVEEPKTENGN